MSGVHGDACDLALTQMRTDRCERILAWWKGAEAVRSALRCGALRLDAGCSIAQDEHGPVDGAGVKIGKFTRERAGLGIGRALRQEGHGGRQDQEYSRR